MNITFCSFNSSSSCEQCDTKDNDIVYTYCENDKDEECDMPEQTLYELEFPLSCSNEARNCNDRFDQCDASPSDNDLNIQTIVEHSNTTESHFGERCEFTPHNSDTQEI